MFQTALLTVGEGWHNYHHSFPYDYRSAELPYIYNVTMKCIEFSEWIGQAYDLKTASRSVSILLLLFVDEQNC